MMIFAFTPQKAPYPEYLSINHRNGAIEFTVRSPTQPPNGSRDYDLPGDTACLSLPLSQVGPLIEALQKIPVDT